MSDINKTLEERGKNYGSFALNSAIMQRIKAAMHEAPNWEKLKPYQKEALDMIAHKIGRILGGNPDLHDSWHDITGYSQLVADILENPPAQERIISEAEFERMANDIQTKAYRRGYL